MAGSSPPNLKLADHVLIRPYRSYDADRGRDLAQHAQGIRVHNFAICSRAKCRLLHPHLESSRRTLTRASRLASKPSMQKVPALPSPEGRIDAAEFQVGQDVG